MIFFGVPVTNFAIAGSAIAADRAPSCVIVGLGVATVGYFVGEYIGGLL